MSTYRTVIREDRFERELAEIQPGARLVDAAVEGLEWILARRPNYGAPIGREPLWATPIYGLGEEFLVYYAFDDQSVTLISIIRSRL